MTSHVLLEGILDVKDPRGSEDRKFWKAWRRQWISFSVIYPTGRKEPHLLLKLSHSSSSPPEREIRIQREGLHLFRCRSKSRPYRTWAIMSGNKLVLYFAAGSEMEAQNWMHEVREGLWPSCFSFQMLTACSHEVSLIDDENSFLSGHLGVYGRFVLTSEDIISLMHPHWGSTLLQISLINVKDVLFIREAEIPPAGVFSIIFKGSNFKVKALQFFCNTAKEAVQWILSKVVTKNCQMKEIFEKKQSAETSISVIVSRDNSVKKKFKSKNTNSSDKYLYASLDCSTNINIVDSEYENLLYLKRGSALHTSRRNTDSNINTTECVSVDKTKSTTEINSTENVITSVNSQKEICDNLPFDNKLDEGNVYANIPHVMNITKTKSQNCISDIYLDTTVSSTTVTDVSILNKNFDAKEIITPSTLGGISEPEMYSTVNKGKSLENSCIQMAKDQIIAHEPLKTNDKHDLLKAKNSELDDKHYSNHLLNDVGTKNVQITCANIESSAKSKSSESNFAYNSNSQEREAVSEQIFPNSSEQVEKTLFSKTDFSSNTASTAQNIHLLPNISCDFLNTSINNSMKFKNKMNDECSSCDEVTGILPWIIDEFDGLDFNERVYEDIIERKGTIYEEIDSSESDDGDTQLLPPELPIRPQNLEIPLSLRLQKLSKSIEQTLGVIESPVTETKQCPRPALIKKVKDVNRIMQISPNPESSRESFKIETKLPPDGKNVLTRSVIKPLVNTANGQHECNTIFKS